MTAKKRTPRPLPSQARIAELVWFDPETGKLYNKPGRPHAPAGKETGSVHSLGYRVAYVDGNHYVVHYLIWKLIYGVDPERELRHIDGDGLNNRLDNLRLADVPAPKPVKQPIIPKELPSREYLRQVFDYDEETGHLTWKIKTGPRSVIGKPVGSINSRGYLTTKLDTVHYKVHRLIWMWMTGEDPGSDVDHIDGCCSNNAWDNLRKVEHHVNNKNCKLGRNNKTGVTGVHWDKRHKKWAANIGDRMKKTVLGRYDTFEEAVEARRKAEEELGYHENHGRLENPAA